MSQLGSEPESSGESEGAARQAVTFIGEALSGTVDYDNGYFSGLRVVFVNELSSCDEPRHSTRLLFNWRGLLMLGH